MIPIDHIKKEYGTEIAVVLLCCRVYFNTEGASTLQQFIDDNIVDWNQVQALAAYHRIEPFIYKIIRHAHIPQEAASPIKQKQHILIQQSFKRALETERIINALKEHRIKCIPYKGVAFSKQFYGDVISRESSDIDLVISPEDFEKVLEIMRQDGYSFGNRLEYDFFKEDIYTEVKDLTFNKYENGHRVFHVEFHWKITGNQYQISKKADSLLCNSDHTALLLKSTVPFLNINAHYLAVFIHHSINDGFSILRNLTDIAQATKNPDILIDKDYIRQTLFDLNLKNAATICCYLLKKLLGVHFSLTEENRIFISAKKKKYFENQLLQKKRIGDHFKVQLFYKSNLYLKDNTWGKISYLIASFRLRFTPSQKDFRIFKLPRKLSFLYIILKPLRSLLSPANTAEEKKITQHQG